MIRLDSATQRISMTLRNDGNGSCFVWHDWVDAAMGSLRGLEYDDDVVLNRKRRIIRADLREPVVEMSPLLEVCDGNLIRTGTSRIWLGWPAFDIRICKFEMDQLLAASDIGLEEYHSENMSPGQKLTSGEEERERNLSEAVDRFEKLSKIIMDSMKHLQFLLSRTITNRGAVMLCDMRSIQNKRTVLKQIKIVEENNVDDLRIT